MMIDVQNETPLSLKEACRLPFLKRAGKPLHIATIHRWASRGSKGIRLETINYPGGMRTTAEAVLRFLAALSGKPTMPTASSSQHRKSIARAEQDLTDNGW